MSVAFTEVTQASGHSMEELTREDRDILHRVAMRAGPSEGYFNEVRKVEELDYRRTFNRLYHCLHPTVGQGTPPSLSAQVQRNIEAYLAKDWAGMGLAVY